MSLARAKLQNACSAVANSQQLTHEPYRKSLIKVYEYRSDPKIVVIASRLTKQVVPKLVS